MLFFFFFQAEDGIRDRNVTGVQTCALPIWIREFRQRRLFHGTVLCSHENKFVGCFQVTRSDECGQFFVFLEFHQAIDGLPRSEERRVGKECRSWWVCGWRTKKRDDMWRESS